MIYKLKRASIVFWILCVVSFIIGLWGSINVLYWDPDFVKIFSIFSEIIVDPLFYPLTDSERMANAICYILLSIPIFFASIAIVLKMLAKALEEQSVKVITLLNEEKKKS